jgi:two-component system cell cycle response regulator
MTAAQVALVCSAPSPAAGETDFAAATPAIPLKVLVAEDDDAARLALEKVVRLLGYECRSARDGLEAWEMHQIEHADVILSDWQMPCLDGTELCRRTRTLDDDGAYTYFILMTSFEDKEHRVRGMEAGADDYHTKPVDLDDLQARLIAAGRVVALYRRLAEKNALLRRDGQRSFRVARIEHLAGDDVLRRIARTIREELREGDGLYRYGGEEFLVLLPEQSLAEASLAMERVRAAIERVAIPTSGSKEFVTISLGVAELDLALDHAPEDWLRRADEALYRAKSNGRNRVETARPHGPRA